MELKVKTNGIENQNQWFHFFNTLYSICSAVTYSFTITYLEYFMAGNFRIKISTICTIHAKFKQYKILRANTLKGKFPLWKKSQTAQFLAGDFLAPLKKL